MFALRAAPMIRSSENRAPNRAHACIVISFAAFAAFASSVSFQMTFASSSAPELIRRLSSSIESAFHQPTLSSLTSGFSLAPLQLERNEETFEKGINELLRRFLQLRVPGKVPLPLPLPLVFHLVSLSIFRIKCEFSRKFAFISILAASLPFLFAWWSTSA